MIRRTSKYSFTIAIILLLIIQLMSNICFGASADTKIKKIEVSPCINNIQQDSENNNVYRVAINNSVTSVNVYVEPSNTKSSVEIQGNNELDVGTNRVDITITSEDGNSESYVIYVRRLSKEIADTTITPNVQEEKQEFVKPATEIQPEDDTSEKNEISNEIETNTTLEENTVLEENIIVEKLENETAKWENNIIDDNSKRRVFIIVAVLVLIVTATIIVIKRKKKYQSRH